jgi:hypothetical protein
VIPILGWKWGAPHFVRLGHLFLFLLHRDLEFPIRSHAHLSCHRAFLYHLVQAFRLVQGVWFHGLVIPWFQRYHEKGMNLDPRAYCRVLLLQDCHLQASFLE